jgi:hypothetical protein
MNTHPESKFAFVVAERPKHDPAQPINDVGMNWTDFLVNVQNIAKPPEGMQKIHDNIWLIPLANGLPFLAGLIQWGGAYRVQIRILFLDEAPNWLQYPPPAERPFGASVVQAAKRDRAVTL